MSTEPTIQLPASPPLASSDWLGRRVQIEGLDMGTVVSETDEGISIRLDKTGKEMFAYKYDIMESPGLWAP